MQIEVLGERYELQEPIGRGGMATIYRGRDTRMDRVVAIKVLKELYSTDPKFVTRFQREAKAASALQHPNIVQVYDYGHTDGSYFIVMELIDGTDLRRYLRTRGILAIDRAIIIAHDVALGLGAAHRRGIVHRDVKPQNVLVGRDGSIKLTDFGIAMIYNSSNAERLTTTGMTLGTVQYYAPEQAQGEIVSPAADIYALGIVMYEMLTGRTPFDGDSPVAVAMQHIQDAPVPPSRLNPNIPPVLEEIILRCLEKVPEMRYRDGSTLARALELLGEDEMGDNMPTQIPPPNAPIPNQIPQRPGNGNGRGGPRSVSSPNNAPPTPAQNGNGVVEPGVLGANGTPPLLPPNEINNAPTISGHPGFNPNAAYYSPMPQDNGSGTTRPFPRGTMPRTGVVQEQQDSRFASIITALILVATLLLLGFSIYLAGILGFIPNAFWAKGATPTPSGQISVPKLIGMSYHEAVIVATNDGLKLNLNKGSANDCVTEQDPFFNQYVAPNTTISVNTGACPTATATGAKVPTGLVGKPLKNVQQVLAANNIAYSLQNAGPNASFGPDIVKDTNPPEGSTVPAQGVIVYVYNCTACTGGTPTAIPTRVPTPIKTPTPGVTPTPGTTPTVGVTPTAGTTPTPGTTPTTGVTPTPGITPTTGTTPPAH